MSWSIRITDGNKRERNGKTFQYLPDELWIQVFTAGVESAILDYRDVCSLSIVCRRLWRLTNLDCTWQILLSRDFNSSSTCQNLYVLPTTKQPEKEPTCKLMYRSRFEKDRAMKMAAHKRRVLRAQSQVAVLINECHHFQQLLFDEKQKLLSSAKRLCDAERARRSSVALKVWQPQVIRNRQEQVVEQQAMDFNFLENELQMEVCVCKERIERFSRSLLKNQMLEKTRGELEALTYRPVQDGQLDLEASDMQSYKKKKFREKEKLSLDIRSQGALNS
ncbi:hypothetical protein O6H91_02G008300 [Diphasiastrum complanatum]|uniref:Uncharacterized protein n=1 Tax=Diphasiastrum complanatum TaxID=34168 RepID=A0ACC2ED11_DIPCM|nr:hypothetical protein O6H91_02G008300 [Diphasiastrum complanatum]